MTLTIVLSALIGVSLGLLGGGGSILTVPILVYAAGLEPKDGIATSLLVVGVTSLAAMPVKPGSLRKGFAWFVLAMAVFMIAKQLPPHRRASSGRSPRPLRSCHGGRARGRSRRRTCMPPRAAWPLPLLTG